MRFYKIFLILLIIFAVSAWFAFDYLAVRHERKAALLFVKNAVVKYNNQYGKLPSNLYDALSLDELRRLESIEQSLTNTVISYDGMGGFVYNPSAYRLGLNYRFMQSLRIILQKPNSADDVLESHDSIHTASEKTKSNGANRVRP